MGECDGLQLGGGTIAVDSIWLGILGFGSHGQSTLDLVLALGSGIHGICRHHHHLALGHTVVAKRGDPDPLSHMGKLVR